MKRNKGFSLIELMIVVEIIGVLAAVAFPNYIRARIQANESAAVGRLKVVLHAQIEFYNANVRYADTFDELTTPVPPYLSGNWEGDISGYTFTIAAGDNNFSASAVPVTFGDTGWRGFFIDSTGIIRWKLDGEATETDTPLGG